MDSTVVRTHSNPNRKHVSDPEASWTAKHSPRAKEDGKEWQWGYKVHMVADVNYGLPLVQITTTARRNDSERQAGSGRWRLHERRNPHVPGAGSDGVCPQRPAEGPPVPLPDRRVSPAGLPGRRPVLRRRGVGRPPGGTSGCSASCGETARSGRLSTANARRLSAPSRA